MNQIVIDGFGLAYRSHYAFNTLTTKAGIPSGLTYGFLTGIRSVKSNYPDFHVTITWDRQASRKKALFADYKANRPELGNREIFSNQIDDLKEFFSYVNVSQTEVEGEEADDVMASVARTYSQEGHLVYLFSSDKDLLQLVQDGKVIVIRPKVAGRPEKAFDEAAVFKKYKVHPRNFACYLSMRGDSSDNIPGVPRAPSKILAGLTEKYHTPRQIYASLADEKLTDFQRKSLLDSEAQIHINYELVRLKDDLEFVLADGRTNVEVLESLLAKYQIKSISAQRYSDMFEKESSFKARKAPSFENYSLFEEE